jgi:VanZ family protein
VRKLVRYWLPVIAWTALILAISSDLFSAEHTGSLLDVLFGRWLSPSQLMIVNIVARKTLHLIGYGILGALGFRAARGEERGFALRWAIAGVAIAVFVACVDEWNQSHIPSRTGTVVDVVVDTVGAMIAQVFARMSSRA